MVGVLFDRPINGGTADTIFLSKALTPTKISDNYSNGYVSCHFCYKENGLKPPTMTGLLYESLLILVLMSITAISPVNLTKWHHQVSKCPFYFLLLTSSVYLPT